MLAAIITPETIFDDGLQIDEGDTRTFSIRLNRAPEREIVARITASSNALTVTPQIILNTSNWDTPQTVTVEAAHDDDTVNEMVSVRVEIEALELDRSFDVTIIDDDLLAIWTSSATVMLRESESATITVALTAQPTSSVAVTIVSSDPDAASAFPTTLSFGPTDWNLPKELRIEAPHDLDVLDEEVQITLSATGLDDVVVEVTVEDDDVLNIQTNLQMVTLTEGTQAVLAVDLDFQPPQDIEVTITSADPALAAVMPARMTFTPQNYNVPQNLTIDALHDDDVQNNSTSISLSAAGLRTVTVPVEIEDDDELAITVNPAMVQIVEGMAGTFTARLAYRPSQDVTVNVTSSDSTVAMVGSAMLTFTPQDWNTPQTVTVNAPHDDDLADGLATITLMSTAIAMPAMVEIRVMDDDTQAILAAPSPLTVPESDTRTLNVRLAFQPGGNVTVSVVSSDPGAVDVMPATLTFTPANWNIEQPVTVLGQDDDDLEDESATITLSSTGVPSVTVPVTVTDNDQQTLVLSETNVTVNEGGTATVNVTLMFRPSADVVVSSFTSDPDVARTNPPQMVFSPQNWNVAQQLTIRGIHDDDVVDNTATITLSGGGGGTIDVTVIDDDVQAIQATPTTLTVPEGLSRNVSVRLAFQPAADVTVSVESGDTAVATVTPATLTFTQANWNVVQQVAVTGEQDDDVVDSTTQLTLSAQGIPDVTVAVTVTDDDVQEIVATPETITVDENGTAQLNVRLRFRPAADTTVNVASSDVGAATVAPQALVFTAANWNMAQAVTVTGVDDADITDENVQITLTSPPIPQRIVPVTVIDDDQQAIVVGAQQVTVAEGGTQTLAVSLQFQPSTDTTVFVQTSDPLAASVNPTVLTFTPGNFGTPQNVTIRGIQDDDVADETVTLTLTAAGIPNQTVTVTVEDDDVQAIVAAPTAVTVIENQTATLNVRLMFRPAANVTVDVESANPAAATANVTALTFTPQNFATPQAITISGVDDADDQDEQTTINLTSAGLAAVMVPVSVVDDDQQNIFVAPTALAIGEGDTGTFSVFLAAQPAADVTVTVASSDAGAATAAPAALTFTPANWDEPQMVTVTGVEDNDTADESVTITLSAPGLTARAVTVEVEDDDVLGIVTSTDTVALTEGETGQVAVRLNFNPVAPLTVTIVSDDTGAVGVSPATLTFNAANFATPQLITLIAVQDQDLADEAVTITLTSPRTPNATIQVDVTDDDEQAIQLSQELINLREGDSTSISARLAFAPAGPVTVTITSSDLGAVTTQPTTLTFNPSNFANPRLVTITALQDADVNDEVALVTFSGAGAPDAIVTVNVADDDEPVIFVSTTALTVAEGGTGTVDVSLGFDPVDPFTLTVASSAAGTATVAPGTLTFTSENFATPQTITIFGVQDDDTVDGTATILLNGAPAVTVTVDDDDQQMLLVSDESVTAVEGGTATFTVRLAFNPLQNASVTVVSSDTGAATVAPGTLTFTAANWAMPQTVTVTGVQDADVLNEIVTITLLTAVAPNVQVTANITDDDVQAIVASATEFAINEGGSATLNVSLAFDPSGTRTVMVTSSDGGAVGATPAMLTFTSQNYNVPQAVTISGLQDDDTADETATLTLSSAGLANVVVNVAVADDDTQAILAAPGTLTFTENGSGQIAVTLAFNPVTETQVTIVSSDEGAATVAPQTLTFTANNYQMPQTVTVSGVDDDDTQDESVTITLAGGGAPAPATVSVTITDPDTQALVISQNTFNMGEGTTATFNVSLAFNPVNDAAVTIASSDAGAATAAPGTLTFTAANWQTPQQVTITAVDDDDINDENVTLTVSGAGAPNQTITVAITDDDVLLIMTDNNALAMTEGDTQTISVQLTANPVNPRSVTVVSSDAGAASVAPTTLNFDATNWNIAQLVTVTAVTDNDVADENVTLTLSSAGTPAIPTVQIQVTVTDPDTQAILTNGDTLNVAEQAQTTMTVRLAFNPVNATTVTITSSDPGAATAAPTMLNFNATNWNVPQNVTITGVADDDTANETVTMTLSSGIAPDTTVTINVTDDDTQAIQVSQNAVTVAEGGTETVTVRLAFNPLATIQVPITSSDDGAVTAAPTPLEFTEANWNVPQTVTITGVQDDDTANETATLTFSSGVTANVVTTVTVIDDDTQALVLANTPAAVPEGGTATLEVSLAFNPVNPTTVSFASSDAARIAAPATLTFTAADWNIAQTVTLAGLEDDDVMNQQVTITVSSPVAPSQMFTVTHTDDDTQAIVLAPNPLAVAEGATAQYTARLAFNPSGVVTVNITNSDTGAATTSVNQLFFDQLNWNDPQTVTVTGVQDDDVLPETVMITHTAPNIAPAVLTVNVADDDAPELVVNPLALLVREGETNTFTVQLSFNPTVTTNVLVASNNEAAATVAPQSLTFNQNNWNIAQTVTVTGEQDDDVLDHTVLVTLTNVLATSNATVTVTVDDDDDQDIILSTNAVTVDEGDTVTVTARLAQDPVTETTVTITSSDPGAATAAQMTLTFNSGNYQTPQDVVITGEQDDDSGDETVTFTFSAPGADPAIPDQILTVTVNDDEQQTIVADTNAIAISEAGNTSAMFNVQLGFDPGDSGLTVTLATTDAEAMSINPATIAFTSANWNVNQTVTVTALDDVDATSETATITISGGNATPAFVIVNVTDNDTLALQFTVEPNPAVQVDEGSTVTIGVRLTARPETNIEITATTNDQPIALVDPQVRTFTPENWNVFQTYGIQGQQDLDLDDETTFITFAQQIGALIAPRDVDVFVRDDDLQRIIVTPTAVALTEGGAATTFTARLAFIPTAGVGGTVTVVSGDTGAATVAPATLTFGAGNYNVAQTITVTPVDDLDTRDEMFNITLTDSQTQAGQMGPARTLVPATVTDDDTQAHVLSDNMLMITEEGAAGTFTVGFMFEPNGPTNIVIASPDPGAVLVSSGAQTPTTATTLTFTQANWMNAQTVMVNGVSDDDVVNEMVNLTVSSTVVGGLNDVDDIVMVTVADDDTQLIALDGAGGTAGACTELGGAAATATRNIQEGTSGTFTFRLAYRPENPTLINLGTSDGAVATVAPATFTINPDEYCVTRTATITATEDLNLNENTANIILSANMVGNSTVAVTAPDNDTQQIVVNTTLVNVTEGGADGTFTVRLAFIPFDGVDEVITVTSPDPGAVQVFRNGDAAGATAPLTFTAANYTMPQTVNVRPIDDDDVRNELVSLALTSDQAMPATPMVVVTASVTDDDVMRIVLTDQTIALTEGGATGDLMVRLSNNPVDDLVVTGASADTGAVMITANAMATFTAGNWMTPQAVTLAPQDDFDMLNEVVNITFTAPGATSTTAVANVTDDDRGNQMIVVNPTDDPLVVTESQIRTLGVQLMFQPNPMEPVTLNLSTADTAVATIAPAVLMFDSNNWNLPQTATVTGVVDDGDLDDEMTSYTIADPRPAPDAMTNPEAAPDVMRDITVEDDDMQSIIVTTVPEGLATSLQEGGPNVTFRIRLGLPPALADGGDAVVEITHTSTVNLTFTPTTATFTTMNFATPVDIIVAAGEDADGFHNNVTAMLQTVNAPNGAAAQTHPIRIIDDEVPVTGQRGFVGFTGGTLGTKRQNVRWGGTVMGISANDTAGNTVLLTQPRELNGDAPASVTLGMTAAGSPVQAIEFDGTNFGAFAMTTAGVTYNRVSTDLTVLNTTNPGVATSVDIWPELIPGSTTYGMIWRESTNGNLFFQNVTAAGAASPLPNGQLVSVADGTPDFRPNLHHRGGAATATSAFTLVYTQAGGTNEVRCVIMNAAGVAQGGEAQLPLFPTNAPLLSSVIRTDVNRIFAVYIDPAIGLRMAVIRPHNCTEDGPHRTLRGLGQYLSPPPFIAFNGNQFAIAYDIQVGPTGQVGVLLVDADLTQRGDYTLGVGSRPSIEWVSDRWAVRYQDDANGNRASVAVGSFSNTCFDGVQNLDETGVDCGGSCAACGP